MNNKVLDIAFVNAGYREKYAMLHGKKREIIVNNHKCIKFEYSEKLEYQDANGATYDTITKNWIG